HGVYKPGHVKLKPGVLKECQDAVVKKHGENARFYLVFHGGSGSALSEIHESLDYGVVKMNVDTDMQYAFTRAIVNHMFKNYDGVLKVDGEVGNKKVYDPRSYLALAEAAMADRVKQAVSDLRGAGMTMFSSWITSYRAHAIYVMVSFSNFCASTSGFGFNAKQELKRRRER